MTAAAHFNLKRLRDLEGRLRHPFFRRTGLVALAAITIAALTGALGQTESTHSTGNEVAQLEVRAPSTLRGGLLWRARVTVTAREELVEPRIVLADGFVDGMQLNTIEPAPDSEASRDGALEFTYPTIPQGDTLTLYLQLQADPTVIGRQDLGVSLISDSGPALHLPRTTRVLP